MFFFFFFVKQNTAYELLRSLVGSEMCIRDRHRVGGGAVPGHFVDLAVAEGVSISGAAEQDLDDLVGGALEILVAGHDDHHVLRTDLLVVQAVGERGVFFALNPVSYTHLTLPTIYSV